MFEHSDMHQCQKLMGVAVLGKHAWLRIINTVLHRTRKIMGVGGMVLGGKLGWGGGLTVK